MRTRDVKQVSPLGDPQDETVEVVLCGRFGRSRDDLLDALAEAALLAPGADAAPIEAVEAVRHAVLQRVGALAFVIHGAVAVAVSLKDHYLSGFRL